MILENYLLEIQQKERYYRAGPEQNIKVFEPKKPTGAHDPKFKSQKLIYVTNDPQCASAFGFEWNDGEGFKLGSVNMGPWTFEIPKQYIDRMRYPCSMYTVTGKDLIRVKGHMREFISYSPLTVVKEEKFATSEEMMKKYKLKIKII